MVLKLLRNALGQVIIFFDFVTRPTPMQRTPESQQAIDAVTSSMALYQFKACPFCVKTRRAMRRLNLNIEKRDAINDQQHRSDLETLGGAIKVPCLRIENKGQTQWMYESNDIIAYLDNRFGNTSETANANT